MLDLIEQSTLYRVIALATTCISVVQLVWHLLDRGAFGARRWFFLADPTGVLVAALLGGFLFPIAVVLLPGRIGAVLYDVFSFGDPSLLVVVGLIIGALSGLIYRAVLRRLMFGVMSGIAMAVGLGFMALIAGGIVAAIGSGGPWSDILGTALSWARIGAMIGAALGLAFGLLGG